MNTKKRLLPALVLSAILGAAAPAVHAQSSPFSNVVVFGDSLSDAGYFRPFLASLGLPAPVVSTLGRFTTNPGPVWSELVASFYGLSANPSNAGGTNYAQGGARITLSPGVSTPPGAAERPIATQINEYLAAHPTADPSAARPAALTTTMRTTSAGCAPSAMRMPISCVRCVTVYAITP